MRMTPDGSDRTAEVLRLAYVEGLGIRTIARRLSMARKTVRKLLGRAPKQLAPPTPRSSILDPHLPTIRRMLEETPELTAPAVLERLRALGYTGGVSILRDRMREIRPRLQREAFLTLDFRPGEAVQVDWADFGYAIPGCPRRVSAFVMALCYSRYLYIEFTLSQAMGSFLRCMERGLAFFGGVTLADIFDNMKTVVLSPRPGATVFNPRFLEYARARGFAVQACNVRRGNEKGRVERPIGFIRDRFWLGRRFADLLDPNVQGTRWRDDFANNRVHEVTGKVPALVFEHEEKRLLRAIPPVPFDTDELLSTGVTKTYRVTFDRNRYSVPSRLVGQSVLVRANDDTVSIFLGPKQVARHARSWGIGEDVKHDSHDDGVLAQKPRAAAGQLPPGLAALGEMGTRYLKVFAAGNRSIQREVTRLVFLTELFGEGHTAAAMHD
jgi:transposase